MSDTPKDPEQQEVPDGPGPGFGTMIINDDLVKVHRAPQNAHLDQPKEEDKPQDAA